VVYPKRFIIIIINSSTSSSCSSTSISTNSGSNCIPARNFDTFPSALMNSTKDGNTLRLLSKVYSLTKCTLNNTIT